MNVLLNAANLRFGGGYTVAISLIRAVAPLRPGDRFFVAHPAGSLYKSLSSHPNVTLLPVSRNFHHSFMERLRYNHHVFPKWCAQHRIDKVASLGNIAFPAKGRPHLLYIQMPHLAYPESVAWKRMDWQSFMRNSFMVQTIAYYMRYATRFAVQTPVMKARLCKRYELDPQNVLILPNAAAVTTGDKEDSQRTPFQSGLPVRLLFLSKWYAHKNFECIIPLAKIIQAKGLPVQLSLTIDKSESPEARALLEAIEGAGLGDIFVNLGNLYMREVGAQMAQHDAVFLPSLLESFSGVYAEALHYRRAIFTSNHDFATALLGDAAFYFDPLRPEHIAEVIEYAISHRDEVNQKIANGTALAATLPDWNAIARQFSDLLDTLS